MPNLSKKPFLYIVLTGSLFSAFILGFLFPRQSFGDSTAFPFLSKRIFIENQNDLLVNFTPLRARLKEMVRVSDDEIGFFFEYLPTGTTIGVNEKVEHRFASLLKVPIVMAYYLQVKDGLNTVDQLYTLEENQLDDRFGTLWKRGAGTQLTAQQLIEEVLTNSDNTAANVLADNIQIEYMQTVFNSLDIYLNKDASGVQIISPKAYASIFKALYLSAILPKKESNQILEIMSRSRHQDSLTANLDPQVKVAHKIGDLKDMLYWDCGVFYVPNRPYSLCVFSTSTDEISKRRISTLSEEVYNFVTQVK